jgi:hypothetical protein
MSDAQHIIRNVRDRLVALANNPPYRFVDTSRHDADAYQQRKRTFVGYSEAEIAAAENRLGVLFPAVFREYLATFGKAAGDLFCGSDLAGIADFEQFKIDAEELLAESGLNEPLPKNAIVFLFHQGYTFLYFLADGAFDAPVYQYVEGDERAAEIGAGFARVIDSEIGLAEENSRNIQASGGYYVSVSNGSVTTTYPAPSSGKRALDGPDRFND